jgi:pyruvate formate lyase activating enzyme
VDRRFFLKCLGCGAALATTPASDLIPEFLGGLQNACAFDVARKLAEVEARHYRKLPEGGIECGICPRRCRITDLERGYCGTRENRGDVYYTLVYGLPCSINIDPIEKKPLYHFYPGTTAFSLATAGCNVNCKFCQNWEISQVRPEELTNIDLPPAEAVSICKTRHVPTIAYTYSEPVIFYEYMYDIAELGQRESIRSVMITGGYIEPEPLAELLPVLDAVKVDLKSIREDYYRDVVDGELRPVLDALVQMRKAGIWLELVYLVVPTLNDSDAELTELARWVKDNLGSDLPLHFSRFHPQYLLRDLPVTPVKTLERAHELARAEGLEYVYIGNVPGHPTENTYCPKCGEVVIARRGYRINAQNLNQNRCKNCNHEIPGLF